RGARAKADKALEKIDKDLKGQGATRKDLTHRDQTIRVYSPQRKPGQLKLEQIAITISDKRIIAADRDSVVTDLLDAIAGKPKGKSISTSKDFQTVLGRATGRIRKALKGGGGAIAAEWYARPFQMGRILRESLKIDRGNDIDILKLLENQGFDAIKAAGGVAAIAGKRFDFLHQGDILAPPTTKEPSKYEKAARMLQFVNTKLAAIPAWVDQSAASFNRLHARIEEAFWASETLVDEALGDKIFRDMIRGIHLDEDGPQIDLANDVLPNLDDQIILITDNTTPIAENSERMLIAIRVLDANKIEDAIRKAMEVEPDTSKLDVVPGVEIWQVQRGEAEESFDPELFNDLEFDFDDDEPPPLLDHWAIAMVDKGPGSNVPYLMFSSHPELLIETAKRIQGGVDGGFAKLDDVKTITTAIKDLGGTHPAFDRAVRMKLSLRAKYELLRKGMLKDSDSLLSALYRRVFEDEEGDQPDPLNAAKLPPIGQVEQFFPNGGSFFEVKPDGWSVT
ncbi:MAG: membrane or secreted protein, partial [Pirellulales bacterium]|nr:membrane or secreted protein [Pirellulales bacterium]